MSPQGPVRPESWDFHRGLFLFSHSKIFLPVRCP